MSFFIVREAYNASRALGAVRAAARTGEPRACKARGGVWAFSRHGRNSRESGRVARTESRSRAMPMIGSHCHELRINDSGVTWRVVYYVDSDAVVILEVLQKKSRTTPKQVIEITRKRLRAYQRAVQEDQR
jgi:hypothetical protein